ncbi:hypothetical protein M569_08261 [Genlisea aurea]|uniref:Late embryogenesis abundant protein n=1 Tax=Genlisea aurea TaxID=192259 RepID=S8CHR8_9LAMI|nr:hypothetical protein M569_08261 [Genlisea aurea]
MGLGGIRLGVLLSSLDLRKMLHRRCIDLQKLLCGRLLNHLHSLLPTKNLAPFSSRCYSARYVHAHGPRRWWISAIRFQISGNRRSYSVEIDKEVDRINLKFAEAREEIESAMESKETVYFNEEAECARTAVGEVLELYGDLLKKLPEAEKAAIQRAMGLKIEQLKAELLQLDE